MEIIDRLLADPSHLRTLKIYGHVDWNSKTLNSLTHFVSIAIGNPPSYSQLFDALQIFNLHDVPLASSTVELPSECSSVFVSRRQRTMLVGSAPTLFGIPSRMLPVTECDDKMAARGVCNSQCVHGARAYFTAWSQEAVVDAALVLPAPRSFFLRLELRWLFEFESFTRNNQIKAQVILAACSAIPFQSLTFRKQSASSSVTAFVVSSTISATLIILATCLMSKKFTPFPAAPNTVIVTVREYPRQAKFDAGSGLHASSPDEFC
ncbi:hypothetical protein M413DRAFT_26687 [Hebeloma cylindrosporum]|uniref:Uncharacterized protein n=1 Tax=Hebeloma cylindrosporum TaxID=76867 RepID=A0A0C2XYH7_HEBCY|nr:hypothetical protein M413DRAFT_26687 [Hebeloma cylindrosporum h7]